MLENKPLSKQEKSKSHPNYQQVVNHYERVTRQQFMREDLIILKLLVEKVYPAQINQAISRFWKMYPQNFTSFSYIYRPVSNMFKNKR